jgi:hypothetical protein
MDRETSPVSVSSFRILFALSHLHRLDEKDGLYSGQKEKKYRLRDWVYARKVYDAIGYASQVIMQLWV